MLFRPEKDETATPPSFTKIPPPPNEHIACLTEIVQDIRKYTDKGEKETAIGMIELLVARAEDYKSELS